MTAGMVRFLYDNYVNLRLMTYTDPNTGKFAKGNPGKPVGAKSDKSKIWDEIGEWFKSDGLEAYLDSLQTMKQVEPTEFMKRYETMLEYFAPKLSRSNVDHTTKGDKIQQGINLSTYTDDELRTIAELQRKGRTSTSESD
jgi:hypothetical protein